MPRLEAERCLLDSRFCKTFSLVPRSPLLWDACATVRCCHGRLNPKEGGKHSVHPGARRCACLWLGRHQSPALARLGQGTTAPAAIALGADLVPGGDTVLVLVCELIDLMCQLLHCARPETAAKAPEALEIIHTLAVALDSDAGGVRTAGNGKESYLRPQQAGLWPQTSGTRVILGPEGVVKCSCHPSSKSSP